MTTWPGERALHGGADRISLHRLGGVTGELWLCGKHFVGPDPEAALARTHTTTVVCLCEPHELKQRYPAYVTWLRVNQPTRALWLPVPDLHVPTPTEREPLFTELLGRLGAGERLLVHCGAGIGRSGTLAVALLITAGLDAVEAAALVAGHRPMAGAESQVQSDFLAELARRDAVPNTPPAPSASCPHAKTSWP